MAEALAAEGFGFGGVFRGRFADNGVIVRNMRGFIIDCPAAGIVNFATKTKTVSTALIIDAVKETR